MNFDFKTTADFFDCFKDEKSCYEYLEKEWWQDGICCPYCGSMKEPYKVKPRYGKDKDIPAYKCSESMCNQNFTIKNKSIFEGTKVELRKWFHAIYELSINKKGISSITLSNKIGVSQKTAWLILHKIRNTVKEENPEQLDGTIQLDETFVGGKNKNRHHDRKVPFSQGRSFKDKTPVLGMIKQGEREAIERPNKVQKGKLVIEKVYTEYPKVRLFVVRDTSAKSIQPLLFRNIKQGSVLFTDEWSAYNNLEPYYQRYFCDHSKGQYYGEGGVTTNKAENFWSIFKRGIIGVYHSVSRKHLKLYCNEFAMRYNNLDLKSFVDKFLYIIRESLKTRATYRFLTRPYPKLLW